MIALLCGIKISAVHHLDLSQSMHMTDRQTDKITNPKTKTESRNVLCNNQQHMFTLSYNVPQYVLYNKLTAVLTKQMATSMPPAKKNLFNLHKPQVVLESPGGVAVPFAPY